MSKKGKFTDNTLFIPFAGVTTALEGVSVDNSLRQDLYFHPSTKTPEEIFKYRSSTRERVGVKPSSWYLKDYENYVHWIKT